MASDERAPAWRPSSEHAATEIMSVARWRPLLASTFRVIEEAAPDFADEWWIIGSAAAALAGADVGEVRDVDLLLSERDAEALLARWREAPKLAVEPGGVFRSAVFARFGHAGLPIEMMGGFELRVRGAWRLIWPLTRESFGAFYAPSVSEQIALLQTMGREKDRSRIAALRALI
jgi:hypothetical protein